MKIAVLAEAGFNRLEQRLLVIPIRLVTVYVGKAECGHDRTDIHVLALDRSLGTTNGFHECTPMLSLVESTSCLLMPEHVEVISDDGIDFVVRPVPCHALSASTCHQVVLDVVQEFGGFRRFGLRFVV